MNKITILYVLFVFCYAVNGQQQSCPGQRQCVSVNNCPPLLALINKPQRTPIEVDLLKKAHCGFIGQTPAVCCPEPKTVCYTPEGNLGECMDVRRCQGLASLLQKPVDPAKAQYVERSKCDGPDQYSVCCGPVPEFKAVERGRCASKMTAIPPDPATHCCGTESGFTDRIRGGNVTSIDQYPWLALIEYHQNGQTQTYCGGVLISARYVLTAAHCIVFNSRDISPPKFVRLAEYDTNNDGEDCAPTSGGGRDCTKGHLSIPVEKTIPHPQYVINSKYHDIALIRLAQPAPFTDFIRPICLPSADVALKTTPFNVTAAGWGKTAETEPNSAIKLDVILPFVSQAQCQPAYQVAGRRQTLMPTQICAGGEDGKDSCKGDSGGPLMYDNGITQEVVGVVSFGPKACGTANVPGVYTNVYQYIRWIRSNIAP